MTELNRQVEALKFNLGIGYTSQEETEGLMKEWINKGWLVLRNGRSPYVEWSKVQK